MSIHSKLGHLAIPIGTSEFQSRDLSIPSPTLCRCATLVRLRTEVNLEKNSPSPHSGYYEESLWLINEQCHPIRHKISFDWIMESDTEYVT